MADNRFYATGKRKTAVARVWLKPGSGNVEVNAMSVTDYFGGGFDYMQKVVKPLVLTDTVAKFDILATLSGGGKIAQTEALRHGIARALLVADPEHRGALKKAGFLTRDQRMKERKKYGHKAARARFQFSKR